MIKRKDEIKESVRHNLRGGEGDVIFRHFLTEEEAYGAVTEKATRSPVREMSLAYLSVL